MIPLTNMTKALFNKAPLLIGGFVEATIGVSQPIHTCHQSMHAHKNPRHIGPESLCVPSI